MPKYKLGQLVRVNPDNDNENYESFKNETLKITHVATNKSEHPGYDNGLKGEGLYDFINNRTKEPINCSLYDYELIVG